MCIVTRTICRENEKTYLTPRELRVKPSEHQNRVHFIKNYDMNNGFSQLRNREQRDIIARFSLMLKLSQLKIIWAQGIDRENGNQRIIYVSRVTYKW